MLEFFPIFFAGANKPTCIVFLSTFERETHNGTDFGQLPAFKGGAAHH